MLFPVASVFSGNATVKAIDKLPLFKQGDKENAQPKIHPLCWQAITYILVMFSPGAIFHAAEMYCLRGWLLYFHIWGKSND